LQAWGLLIRWLKSGLSQTALVELRQAYKLKK